jgi:hypothetical protein
LTAFIGDQPSIACASRSLSGKQYPHQLTAVQAIPEDMAMEMFEEALEPFVQEMKRLMDNTTVFLKLSRLK